MTNPILELRKIDPDPGNPVFAMTESFKMQVLDMFIDATHITIFRELSTEEKAATFTTGTITALAAVLLSGCKTREKNEEIVAYLKACVEQAAVTVARMIADAKQGG